MTKRLAVSTLLLFAATAFGSPSRQPAPGFTIPVIGDAAGGRARYFSTMLIENHLDRDQRVRIDFYPANGGSRNDYPRYLTVPAHSTIVQQTSLIHNRLGLLPAGAMGAERFVAVTDSGADDPAGRISGQATITAVPIHAEGTYRQEIDQVQDADLSGGGEELVFFGARGGHSHTNVGVVNSDPVSSATFAVELIKNGIRQSAFVITVGPASVVQVTAPALEHAPDHMTVRIVRTTESASKWTAYVSVVDDRTGDGWTATRIQQPHLILGCGDPLKSCGL